MPNCHWFGTQDDHVDILTDIFADDGFEVYAANSEPDQQLRVFRSADEVTQLFTDGKATPAGNAGVYLMLWVVGSGPGVEISRYYLESEPSKWASFDKPQWRESCSPLGCVDVHLQLAESQGVINYSATNTLSEARMGAVDGVFIGESGIIWDMRATNRKSATLNRLIRRKSVARINAMAVLPGAARLWHAGGDLGHWSKLRTPGAFVSN